MKAMLIRRFGEPDVFEPAELPEPVAATGQVLVRVRASSVNPVDCRIRRNGPPIAPPLPALLHGDVAGTIEAVGDAVEGFAVGDAVYGCAGGVRGNAGALAERMSCDARLLAPVPAMLDFAAAAALPLVTITAWEGLFERARLVVGERVLVIGGTGGVGHVALQLARIAGAEVTATVASPGKAALARQLGARHTILRTQEPIAEAALRLTGGEGYDLVFDAVGGKLIEQALGAARIGGRVVTIQAQAEVALGLAHTRNLSLHAEFMLVPLLTGRGRERHGQILRQAARLVDAGLLRPLLDSQRFGFTRVADAHRRLESGEAVGKLVLENDL